MAILAVLSSAHAAVASAPYATVGHDRLLGAFNGTPSTAGPAQINLSGDAPGYLNAIDPAALGSVSTTPLPQGVETVIGVAIHVTDSAGPSHSLSSLNDPALADLVFGLNHSGFGGDFPITIYAYNNAPFQYTGAQSLLSTGEASLGGQPFDLLLVGANTAQPFGSRMYWSLNLVPAINTIDGITSISVTDIGAVPEPSGLLCLFAPALLLRRRS